MREVVCVSMCLVFVAFEEIGTTQMDKADNIHSLFSGQVYIPSWLSWRARSQLTGKHHKGVALHVR